MTVPPSPSLRLRLPEEENEEIHGATVVYAVLEEYQQTRSVTFVVNGTVTALPDVSAMETACFAYRKSATLSEDVL